MDSNDSNNNARNSRSSSTERSQGDASDTRSSNQPALTEEESSRGTEDVSVGTNKAEALSTIIEEGRGVVEAARAVGQLNADWLLHIYAVAQQLENVYRSEISSTTVSYKEAAKRTKDYVSSLSELSDMIHTASQDYLQCNGMYRDRLSVLAKITPGNVAGPVKNEEEKTEAELEAEFKTIGRQLKAVKLARLFEEPSSSDNSTRRKVAKMMAEMMVEKEERFGIPLPVEIELPAINGPDAPNEKEG